MPKSFISVTMAKRRKLLLSVAIGGVLLVAGLVAVVFLVSKGQDLRQQAAGTQSYSCGTDADCPKAPAGQKYSCVANTCRLIGVYSGPCKEGDSPSCLNGVAAACTATLGPDHQPKWNWVKTTCTNGCNAISTGCQVRTSECQLGKTQCRERVVNGVKKGSTYLCQPGAKGSQFEGVPTWYPKGTCKGGCNYNGTQCLDGQEVP